MVESELNDQNPHLADDGNRHKEVVDLYTSHIYAAINKRNENLLVLMLDLQIVF